ncbi:MAG: ion transporter, partial [Myxococcota bacterium]|nr:ion transporter [Myxococcota bacterium]
MDQLHAAFHRPNTTIYRWTQGVVWFLILISIGILTLEVVADAPFARRPEVLLADRVILWIFVGEMGLRVLSFRPPDLNFYQGNSLWRIRINLTGRVGYLFQPLTIVDLLAILALDPTLRGLRALRLLRLLRILPFFRYSSPFLGLARVFQENALLYLATLGALLSLATIGGLSLYHVESQANPLVTNAWDGIWWALVTLTTVGYGDITPATTLGRIIGGFLMVGGMFMIAVFAGTVSSTLL